MAGAPRVPISLSADDISHCVRAQSMALDRNQTIGVQLKFDKIEQIKGPALAYPAALGPDLSLC